VLKNSYRHTGYNLNVVVNIRQNRIPERCDIVGKLAPLKSFYEKYILWGVSGDRCV
jgi:hypothetical protein